MIIGEMCVNGAVKKYCLIVRGIGFNSWGRRVKIFKVIRHFDESGISGTGHVIDGVIFDDGTTVIKWLSDRTSIAIYKTFEDFKFLHIDSHPSNETEIIVGVERVKVNILEEYISKRPLCQYSCEQCKQWADWFNELEEVLDNE